MYIMYEIEGLQVLLNGRSQCCLRHSSNDCIHLLAILEDHYSRDAANTVLSSDARALVSVKLKALQLAGVLLSNLIDQRRNHAAGPAPWGPEIDKDGNIAFENEALECSVCNRPCLWKHTKIDRPLEHCFLTPF